MKKELENTITESRYKIPQDILLDILRIVITNKVKYRIAGIMEKENTLLMNITYTKGTYISQKTRENIETMLSDYSNYMNEQNAYVLSAEEDEEEAKNVAAEF